MYSDPIVNAQLTSNIHIVNACAKMDLSPNFLCTGFDLDGHCTVPRFISEVVHSLRVARECYGVVQWVRGGEPGDVHRRSSLCQ